MRSFHGDDDATKSANFLLISPNQISKFQNSSRVSPIPKPHKPNSPSMMLRRKKFGSGEIRTRDSNNIGIPRQVRVSLYSNAHNSYVVIFESNRKYARAMTCIRLSSCDVTRVDDVIIRLSQRDVMTIELRARHVEMAVEWKELLTRKNKSRVMPTLEEEVDESEVTGSNPISAEIFLSSSKQQNYHRSKSLNSFFKTLHSNFNRSAVLAV